MPQTFRGRNGTVTNLSTILLVDLVHLLTIGAWCIAEDTYDSMQCRVERDFLSNLIVMNAFELLQTDSGISNDQ